MTGQDELPGHHGAVPIPIDPRPLTKAERAVLSHMLSADFPGVIELRSQLDHAEATGIWVDGLPSVDLRVPRSIARADIPGSLAPVEGEVTDEHGAQTGTLLIWLDTGTLAGLEYAWVTDEPPTTLPEPTQIHLTIRS